MSDRGIGYYIPPELREKGTQLVNLLSAIDPAQGIMRGMRASGKAFDSDLPPDERKAAAIEAVLETAAPVGMIGLGALAKQPVKATLLDVLTPTGAPASMTDDVISDPSRRAFLKGAAATGGIAALAPDVIVEALEKVPSAVKRVRPGGPIEDVLAMMERLKKERSGLFEESRKLQKKIQPFMGRNEYNLPIQVDSPQQIVDANEAMAKNVEVQKEINRLDMTMTSNMRDLITSIERVPESITNASDEALNDFIEEMYDSPYLTEQLDNPVFEKIADEIKDRGLHVMKDDEGRDIFPALSDLVMDVTPLNVTSGKRELPDDILKEIADQKIREMKQSLEYKIIDMVDQGKTPEQIEKARAEGQADIYEAEGLPRDMGDFYAEGGVVSLKDTAVNMYRGSKGIAGYQPFANGGEPLTEYGRRNENAVRYFDRLTYGPEFVPEVGMIKMPEELRSGDVGKAIEDHEYRHLAIAELRNLYNDNPAELVNRFGREAYDKVGQVLELAGGYPYERGPTQNAIEEKFVELFDPPIVDEYARPTDPSSMAGAFGIITEKSKSDELQSPELREGVMAALRGEITEEELQQIPQVEKVSEYLRTESMKSQQRPPTEYTYGEEGRAGKLLPFLEQVTDVREVVPLMKDLGAILDRLPGPRPTDGTVRPEQTDAEYLLKAYKRKFGKGYSSIKKMSPEDRKAEVKRLFEIGAQLGAEIGKDFISPVEFERIIFPDG